MKTVISLPDDVTAAAAALADRLGVPLNDLYAEALVAYCQKYADRERASDRLTQFYAETSSKLDPAIAQMQFASIPYEEW
jgi:hypothetical protein